MPNYRYQQGDQPLEGYTIQYALGRGGFGEVYFGISDSGREVALKAVQNYEDVELRGISHCMNLKSPHLVTIFDVRRGQGGVPWVIMEYVSGPSLHEVLTEAGSEGIGEDQALFFTRELIKGLRYLHDAGVVHRDLKPHNIFFEDGTVKIGDYSLSKAISGTQQTGHTTTVGSVHYMAPEIGEGKYDKSVDIYAMGVILFEMLTGSPPYVGESMAEVLIKHLTSEPDVSQLSQPFADVIQTAMQRDPADRFASVDEMLLALCPTDHSSYLAPPTSLTMIGERAAKNRASQNHASLGGRAQPLSGPPPNLTDTFFPTAEMVDTKENKPDSDSMPFSRPGFSVPSGASNWLSVPGLLWCPTGNHLASSDSVLLVWRILVALLISSALVGLSTISELNLKGGFLPILPPLIVSLAAAMVWMMRQFLPRSTELGWTITSRICAGILVYLVAIVFAVVWTEFSSVGRPALVHEPVVWFFLSMILIDWRCFISADRYPRVGLARTASVTAFFVVPFLFDGWQGDGSLLLAALSVVAIVISIQLIAPQHRALATQSDAARKLKPTPRSSDATVDPALANTQAEQSEIQVTQETI